MDSTRSAVRPLGHDHRAVAQVGRSARLELVFGVRGGRTVLVHSYAEPPCRVGRPMPDGDGVHLIIASSAPGVFGGDALTQSVVVEAGARVRLTSQSALQVHATGNGARATIAASYQVASGGRLTCEWDPLIPFPNASLDQHIAIEVAGSGALIWSDAFMAGREARGERWQFSRFAHELRLLRDETLIYMERYAITPASQAPSRRWIADSVCYFGTVLALGPGFDRDVAALLHQDLDEIRSTRSSADGLDTDLLLARIAGDEGTSFHRARARATTMLRVRADDCGMKRGGGSPEPP